MIGHGIRPTRRHPADCVNVRPQVLQKPASILLAVLHAGQTFCVVWLNTGWLPDGGAAACGGESDGSAARQRLQKRAPGRFGFLQFGQMTGAIVYTKTTDESFFESLAELGHFHLETADAARHCVVDERDDGCQCTRNQRNQQGAQDVDKKGE